MFLWDPGTTEYYWIDFIVKRAHIKYCLDSAGDGTNAPISSISVAAHADQKEVIDKDSSEKLENATTSIPGPIALPTNISRLVIVFYNI